MSRTYKTCPVLLKRHRDKTYTTYSVLLIDCKKSHKPKHKCPKVWKRILSHSRKAKIKQAMREEGYDNIPIFCKENDWRWLA